MRWGLGILMAACVLAMDCAAEGAKVSPLRWGVDTLGAPDDFERHPWAAELFKEFGFNFWVLHAREKP